MEKMKQKFVINHEDDENVTVFLNGKQVGSANHDEDGWSGIEKVEKIVKSIAGVLKIPVVEKY